MDKIDIKFRCSSLKDFISAKTTAGYKKAKARIIAKYIYNREPIVTNKCMSKGTNSEHESIKLYRSVFGFCTKYNDGELSSELLTGNPDIVTKDEVIDIKTSYDILTFLAIDQKQAEDDYYYQLLGYMLLTGKRKAKLAYCLVSHTPDEIYTEYKCAKWGLKIQDDTDEAVELEKKLEHYYTVDQIPKQERIKIFELTFDQKKADKLIERLTEVKKEVELEYPQYFS